MITITTTYGDPCCRTRHNVRPKLWKYPAGESGAVLPQGWTHKGQYGVTNIPYPDEVQFNLFFEGDHDLIQLAQLADALKYERLRPEGITTSFYHRVKRVELFIPYFPYARQDRITETGGAHALRALARIINNMGFDRVVTLDAHSYALESLIDNLYAIPQEDCARALPEFDILIAPDAGAMSKVRRHGQVRAGVAQVLYATKVRDQNGKITETKLPDAEQVAGKSVCVVDDACDGGATFLELGPIIRAANPSRLSLYVTHGLFTKGVKELCEVYDHIYYVYRPQVLEAIPVGDDGLPKLTVISDLATSVVEGL